MSTSKNRRLAAILFADIVGYTALMQKDEIKASTILRNFQQQLEEEVINHNGQIVNSYGDGALCTFQIPIDAVRCAMALQTIFQNEPKTPVRIGIHSGTVTYEGEKIFGDSVNITSRIESMGVAGGILLSKKVRDEVKNNPDLKMQSLGSFEFKNVEEPMAVFALANEGLIVPKKENIKGKLKTPPPPKSNKIIYGLIGLVGLISLAGFYFWKTDTTQQKAEIIKERIAVLPFENHTNDADLAVLGVMAADWINQGLMDIEEAEVVSPFTVRSHKASIGIPANDPQGRPSFAELTGAQNLIVGNYYKEKEELLFKLEIVDALEGKLLYGFEPIRGAVQDKEALISKLRATITGYWAARDLVDENKIKAPNYEAYKLYTEGLQFHEMPNDLLLKILDLDSTFYLPRILYLNSNRAFLEDKRHFHFLDRHLSELSNYERGFYNFLKHYYASNFLVAFESLNRIRQKYPKDFLLNHETASEAIGSLFNPELCLSIYDELDIKTFQPEIAGVYYNWRFFNYVSSLFYLKKWDALDDFMNSTPPNRDAHLWPYYYARLFSLAIKNDAKKIGTVLTEIKNSDSFSRLWTYTTLNALSISTEISDELRPIWLTELEALLAPSSQDPLLQELIGHTIAYYQKKSKPINWDKMANAPTWLQSEIITAAALVDIGKGDAQAANYKITQIKTLIEQDTTIRSPIYTYGFPYYNLGQLYIQIGDIDQAMYYLKKSRKLGGYRLPENYEYDPLLAPLYELPEFKELIEPVWPAVKN